MSRFTTRRPEWVTAEDIKTEHGDDRGAAEIVEMGDSEWKIYKGTHWVALVSVAAIVAAVIALVVV